MRFALAPWLACSLLLAACARKTGREHVRGRLRCVQYTVPRWRQYTTNVDWRVTFDGSPIAGLRSTSVCAGSPDPSTELLALLRDGVRVEGDRAVVFPLHTTSAFALWACAGRCLVFRGGANLSGGVQRLDTGAFTAFKPLPGQPLSLSPDQRRVVSALPSDDRTHALCEIDLDTQSATRWTVPRASAPWLERCLPAIGLDDYSECLGRRGANLRWARGANGRDALIAPTGASGRPATWERCAAR
jgi:hypothetical protein